MFRLSKLKKSTPEQEAEFGKMLKEQNVSFKDKLAMVLSAFLVIVLPCLGILVLIGVIMLLIFGGFR